MESATVQSSQRPRNVVTLLVAASFCVIIAVVVWTTHVRYRDFVNYHRSIALSAVGELSGAIERIITERHRLVQLFADDHPELIAAVKNDPDDYDAHEELSGAIKRYFPRFFTFTLVDRDGQQLLEDFDGYVGDLCLTDVADYARSGINRLRVHPNAFVYHYDVMAELGDDEGILLVSFPADELSGLLRASQAPGHELLLVQPDESYLLEVLDRGARDKLPRDDYRMREDERDRILVEKEIAHSRWALVDTIDEKFVATHRRELLYPMGALVVVFAMLGLAIAWMMRRNESIRRRADKIKEDFVSVVNHELRTPLTSIQGSLALLEGGVCGEISGKAGELLDIALRNTERLRLLVDDLLDIRKIEAGKLELQLAQHDIINLVRKSIEQNRGYALRFDVRFALRAMAENVLVEVDGFRISQVLANLLSNAAKYSRPGDVVDVFVRAAGEREVEVAVSDQGPGIDPEFRSRLFEKFAQGDAGDSRRSSGTGLGLSIVKVLVEAHRGSVGYRPNAGPGSTFYFRLPTVA